MYALSTSKLQTILQVNQNDELHQKMFQKSHHLQYKQHKAESQPKSSHLNRLKCPRSTKILTHELDNKSTKIIFEFDSNAIREKLMIR